MMQPLKTLLSFLALLTTFGSWAEAQSVAHPMDCGNLNQRKCKLSDWERVNMRLGTSRSCEPDLKEVDGYCRNDKRQQFTRDRSWTAWALDQQLYSIGKDTPINFITWPASHNAYSNVTQDFDSNLYTNHYWSITDQLQLGIRHLELDPKYFTQAFGGIPLGDVALRVCHAKSVAFCLLPHYGNRLFASVLQEIAAWVDANPGQIVYVKIDDIDLNGVYPLLYDEIAYYLGNRVYRAPSSWSRWPTTQEIRNAGKQIIVVQHNNSVSGTNYVWDASGLVQESNHPADQNFDTCTANDGYTPATRGASKPKTWWDTAEGRAKTNTGDAATGLYWEGDVVKAAKCGVSVIGMDFVGALFAERNVSQRVVPIDTRLTYVVWSWRTDDYGQAGPASMDAGSGRWASRPASTVMPVACGIKLAPGSTIQDRQWKITSAQLPWNAALAEQQCVAEFGSQYGFGYPVNGWQNTQLQKAAGGQNVWLNYSVVTTPNLSVNGTQFVARMNPGGSVPAAQELRIYTAPGSSVGIKSTSGPAAIKVDFPLQTLTSGQAVVPVTIDPSASSLPAGEYIATFDIGSQLGNQNGETVKIAVTLVVRAAPSLTLTSDVQSARQGSPVTFTLGLSGASNAPGGDVKVYRIADANGNSTGEQTVGYGTIDPVAKLAKISISNLPLGSNTYSAVYGGDNNNLGADSNSLVVNITQRITAAPSPVLFRMATGGAIPNVQNVALTGVGAQPRVQFTGCDWLKGAVSGSTLTIGLGDPAKLLAPGTYSCTASISDALTSQNLGGGDIPVVLYVQTTLSSSPASVNTWTGSGATNVSLGITAAGNAAADLTVSANQPWIAAQLNSQKTPATVDLTLSTTGLAPGVHNGQLTISSPVAPSIDIPITLTVVAPSIFTTQPAGQTVLIDGVPRVTPFQTEWQPGSTHTVSAATQTKDGTRYTFLNWQTPTGTSSSGSLPVAATAQGGTWTATFSTAYRFTADIAPADGGSVAVIPSSADGFYAPGTMLQVKATPNDQFHFTGWLGAVTGTQSVQQLTLNAPAAAVANFSRIQPVRVNLNANAPAALVIVDGTPYSLPASFAWVPGQTHTIEAPVNTADASPGVRWAFVSWSTGANRVQIITTPQTDATITATFGRQFLLTLSTAPQNGGTVTGGGWYSDGATATITATPNTGYRFSGFTGALTAATSPRNLVMAAPRTLVANFAPAGNPVLTAATNAGRSDGPAAGQRVLPLLVTNSGAGAAVGAQIASITGIDVVTGSGVVTLATPVPVALSDLDPGRSTTVNLLVNWPSTAARVRFMVNFAVNGRPVGSTTLTLFR